MATNDIAMHALPLVMTLLSVTQLKLDNGMTVIVHEDHTVPMVAVNLWYHVGSRDEVKGKTGFAHLFEHMMFKGSAHVGDDQHFKYVQEAGGYNNASTSQDRTNYFEVLPSNFLERALWLESDRMATLLATLTQEKLDNQRDVVRNERRQRIENVPYGGAQQAILEAIYPPGHPYRHLVVGEHADLESASLDDVRAFFAKYYVPANASLTIDGDVDVATAKRLAEKWFGGIPSPARVDKPVTTAPPDVKLTAEKRVQLNDRVSLERVYLVWPSPRELAPGDAELDLLSAVLGGKSGRLYKRLVYDTRLAQNVFVNQVSAAWGSTFQVVATAKPGHTAAELVPVIDEELARVKKDLLSDAELQKVKNQWEATFFYGLIGAQGRADALNHYQYATGDAAYIDRDLQRYRDADAAGVRTWAQRVLGPGRARVVVSPMPPGAPPPAGKPGAPASGGKASAPVMAPTGAKASAVPTPSTESKTAAPATGSKAAPAPEAAASSGARSPAPTTSVAPASGARSPAPNPSATTSSGTTPAAPSNGANRATPATGGGAPNAGAVR